MIEIDFHKSYISQKILVAMLNEKIKHNGASLRKLLDGNSCTIINGINNLSKIGLVNKEMSGRINYVTLTKKGKEIAMRLFEIDELLKGGKIPDEKKQNRNKQ